MDFELVSEDSVPALELRIAELVKRINGLKSAVGVARFELECTESLFNRAAKAARTPVRRSCEE